MLAVPASRSIALLCFVVAYSGGCGATTGEPKPAVIQIAQAPNANPQAPDGPAIPAERKIIYNSQIEMIVDDQTSAERRLQELIHSIQDAGGYLGRQELTGKAGSHRQSSWTIRVPLSKFDGFVAEIEKLGEVQRKSREAQDVTEAYADLEAQLRNKQVSESRLLGHLEKTGDLKDTLECERELSRVRGEIERLQGQFNLMKNKTDLATVVVTIHERAHYVPPDSPKFLVLVLRTFGDSCRALLLFGQGLTLIVVAVTPWLIVAAMASLPAWGIYRFATRRLGRSK